MTTRRTFIGRLLAGAAAVVAAPFVCPVRAKSPVADEPIWGHMTVYVSCPNGSFHQVEVPIKYSTWCKIDNVLIEANPYRRGIDGP